MPTKDRWLTDSLTGKSVEITSTRRLAVTTTAAGSLGDGSKTVTSAGTAEALAASTDCAKVVITAKSANTGNIYVGGSTIDSTRGKPLVPLQDIEILIDDLSKVYIDADTNGEGVTYMYTS